MIKVLIEPVEPEEDQSISYSDSGSDNAQLKSFFGENNSFALVFSRKLLVDIEEYDNTFYYV